MKNKSLDENIKIDRPNLVGEDALHERYQEEKFF